MDSGPWKTIWRTNGKQLGEVRSRRDLERHIGVLLFARTHIPDIELFLRPMREHLSKAKVERLSEKEWGLISKRVRDTYKSCLDCHQSLSLIRDRFSRFLLFTDWTDFHVGYMLFVVSTETGMRKLLDWDHIVCKRRHPAIAGS